MKHNSNQEQRFGIGRRKVLGTAAAGALGLGIGQAAGEEGSGSNASNSEFAVKEHDHSGEYGTSTKLGEHAPLDSVHTQNVTVDNFDLPASHLVFEHDDVWYAMQTDTQDVVFSDSDGGTVVNHALDEGAAVRVVSTEAGTILQTPTTIEHTSGETGLILEKGVTLHYTGEEAAVDIAGNGLRFEFDKIVGGKYCIRDIGSGTSYINGYQLRGASESLWYTDAENFLHGGVANNYVNIRWMLCSTSSTPYGIKMDDAPDAAAEGHRFDIGVILAPEEKGVVVGEKGNTADSMSFHLFNVDVDPRAGAVRLVEINDNQNAVVLEGFTPVINGEWDVEIAGDAIDSFVTTHTSNSFLRVKRENLDLTDETKSDPFSHETFELDLMPDSLEFYKTDSTGSGSVEPSDEGMVVQSTGTTAESVAAISRKIPYDFGNSSFTNQAAIQTHLKATSNSDQEIHAVWGDPDGQSVGWHVEDDVLYGYASDGDGSTTVPLEEGFPAGAEWDLTAFYNPPTDVHFYVQVPLDEFSTPADFIEPPREGVNVWQWPTPLASIDEHIPSGDADSGTAMSIQLENTAASDKQLHWSIWRNHQYPNTGKYNSFKQLF